MRPRAVRTIALASMIALAAAAAQVSGCGESADSLWMARGRCPTELDDGNPCTRDSCAGGQVSHSALPDNSSCVLGTNAGSCQAGICVLGCAAGSGCPCATEADCPMSKECETWACQSGTCSASRPADTPIAMQPAGDCKVIVCDGTGSTREDPDDTDVPADDGDFCTADQCDGNGNIVRLQIGSGDSCYGQAGVCDSTGQCVECIEPDIGCETGKTCYTQGPAHDCVSCTDTVQNGDEVDVDCRGSCATCAQGKKCMAATDCMTGQCVDGVCCENGCAGQCRVCNLPGKEGICGDIPTGQDDPNDPCGTNQACLVGTGCAGLSGADCNSGNDCISGMCDMMTNKCL